MRTCKESAYVLANEYSPGDVVAVFANEYVCIGLEGAPVGTDVRDGRVWQRVGHQDPPGAMGEPGVRKDYKVCVYAICKNEVKFARRWYESVKEADYVVVLDTGSDDGTPDMLRELGASVTVEKITPWRFDVARNRSMELIPTDTDICVCVDLDEVMSPGWGQKLRAAWGPDVTRARYPYVWREGTEAAPEVRFHGEKVHAYGVFEWRYPVHETLFYTGGVLERQVFVDMPVIHRPDDGKSRGQYLPLLELAAEENPQDDRVAFYLGREYEFHGRTDDAVREYRRYMTLPERSFREQNAQVCLRLGALTAEESWFARAICECPDIREPYVEYAQFLLARERWEGALFFAQRSLAVTELRENFLVDMGCWGHRPWDVMSVAAFYLGRRDDALVFSRRALGYQPEDKRLLKNYFLICEGRRE